jgi:molybdopterin converting factor small subunit
MRVALDHEYAAWDSPLGTGSEIAIIPPVSGG